MLCRIIIVKTVSSGQRMKLFAVLKVRPWRIQCNVSVVRHITAESMCIRCWIPDIFLLRIPTLRLLRVFIVYCWSVSIADAYLETALRLQCSWSKESIARQASSSDPPPPSYKYKNITPIHPNNPKTKFVASAAPRREDDWVSGFGLCGHCCSISGSWLYFLGVI